MAVGMKLVLDDQTTFWLGHVLAHLLAEYEHPERAHRPSEAVYNEIIVPLWNAVENYLLLAKKESTLERLYACAFGAPPEDLDQRD
jgi:hypothetical protein